MLCKCWSVRCSADMVSARLCIVLDQPSPAARPRSRCVRGTFGTRPLRPPASLLHNAALPSVPASRCAKAPLGARHRLAPCRLKATGVMQSGLRWSRSHSPRSLARPTRRRLRAFVVVVAPRCIVAEAVCQVLRLNDRFAARSGHSRVTGIWKPIWHQIPVW